MRNIDALSSLDGDVICSHHLLARLLSEIILVGYRLLSM
jgi:hypothetical protein